MNLHLEPGEEELENLPLSGSARDAMRALVDVGARPGPGPAARGARRAGAAPYPPEPCYRRCIWACAPLRCSLALGVLTVERPPAPWLSVSLIHI